MLGFELTPMKDQGPSSNILILGAELRINSDTIEVEIPKQRAVNTSALLRDVLLKNRLTPGGAAEIRWELSFAASLGFGRIGRGMLRPIARRQYSNGYFKLDSSLKICLEWRIGCLARIPRESCHWVKIVSYPCTLMQWAMAI